MNTQTKAPVAHTPEPWSKSGLTIFAQRNAGGRKVFIADVSLDAGVAVSKANAERIASCVNACAGLADPAATIAALREALSECITNDGAHCLAYGTDTPALRARLASISNTARAALAQTKGTP